MNQMYIAHVGTLLKRPLTDTEVVRAEELRSGGKSIEEIANVLNENACVTWKPMTKRQFAEGAKKFNGWMDGDIARFLTVSGKMAFEKWLEDNRY